MTGRRIVVLLLALALVGAGTLGVALAVASSNREPTTRPAPQGSTISAPRAATASAPNGPTAVPKWTPSETLDEFIAVNAARGRTIEPARGSSRLSENEAIRLARASRKTSAVVARYVLFSENPEFNKRRVWLVSLEGMTILRHGGPQISNSVKAATAHHELNVVIDDATGEELMSYSFR